MQLSEIYFNLVYISAEAVKKKIPDISVLL